MGKQSDNMDSYSNKRHKSSSLILNVTHYLVKKVNNSPITQVVVGLTKMLKSYAIGVI